MWGYPGAQNKFNCIGARTCRCEPDLPEVGWRQKRMRPRSVWDNEGRADPLEVAFHQEASPVFGDDFSCSAQLAAQIAGRSADDPASLDLKNFERHQATLKFGLTF